MMSRHFRLSSELSEAIAKSSYMPKISFLCLAVSSINSLQKYIYTVPGQKYSTTTETAIQIRSIKVGLFIKEYVLKLLEILYF